MKINLKQHPILKSRVIDIALLVLLSCLSLFIVLPQMNDSIWYDEACTADYSLMSFSEFTGIFASGNSLPAYYLFMRGWAAVFGVGEAALRLPGVIFYILSICCVYFFGKRLFSGRGPAFASALIYLLLQINTSNAVNAKPYGMLALLCIISLMLFYELFIEGRKGRFTLAAFVAVNIIGSFTHIWFFFAAFSQAVCYILIKRALDRRFVTAFLCSFIPFFLLWSPVLYSQLRGPANDWMKFRGNEIAATINYFTAGIPLAVLLISLVLLLSGFLAKKMVKKQIDYAPLNGNALFLLAVLAVSLIVPAVISLFKPIFIVDRGPMIAAAPFALLLGGYLCSVSYRPLFYAALVFFSLYIYIKFYSARGVNYVNDRTLAKLVISTAADTDNVAFYGELKRPMRYYFRKFSSNSGPGIINLPENPGAAIGGKKLLFVFWDKDSSRPGFKPVYEKLNKNYKIISIMGCAGITIVKYNLSRKPQ